MTDIQLGNEKTVVAACRAYKRACRILRHREEDYRSGRIGVTAKTVDAAKTAAADARERLLYLIETGEKSYPKAKKEK